MFGKTHLQVRVTSDGGWEVMRFTGRESHHPTLEAALEHAEALILGDLEGGFSSVQIHRWNGVIETRIFQQMEYHVNPATDPVFRATMELR